MDELDRGNSLVRNEPAPEREQKELQTFQGVAPVKRKPVRGLAKWVSDMFFSGMSWKNIVKSLIENQIVPELKDGFRNALVSMIDMRLYKDTAGPNNASSLPTGNFVTRYINYAAPGSTATKMALEANQKKDEEIKKSGYELPSFTDARTANDFLASMKLEAERFGALSVHDIAWKQGQDIDYTWDAYGWTNEVIQAIKGPKRLSPPIVVNGTKRYYIIDMPKATLLED